MRGGFRRRLSRRGGRLRREPRPGGGEDQLPRLFLELHVEQGPCPRGARRAARGRHRDRRLRARRARRRGPSGARGNDADGRPRRCARRRRVRDPARTGCALAIPGRGCDDRPGRRSSPAARTSFRRASSSASTSARRTRRGSTRWLPRSASSPATASSPRSSRALLRRRFGTRSPPKGSPLVELPSGAGHDAGILAAAGVDAGDALRAEPQRRGESLARTSCPRTRTSCSRVDVLAGRARAGLRLGERDVLGAVPEHPPAELAQVLVAGDDRREVVPRERAGLAPRRRRSRTRAGARSRSRRPGRRSSSPGLG